MRGDKPGYAPLQRNQIFCTEETPWDGTVPPGSVIVHAKAREVGEQRDGYPGGDIITIECPICKKQWTEELPQ